MQNQASAEASEASDNEEGRCEAQEGLAVACRQDRRRVEGGEKDDLMQKLAQTRFLNERLAQKLRAPALVENKATTGRSKWQLQALRPAMCDEQGKADFRKIEAEQTYQLLETLLGELATRIQGVKEFLCCKYKVATGGASHHTLLEQVHRNRSSGIFPDAAAPVVKRPQAFEGHYMPKWNARLAQKATTHRFI